MSDLSLYSFNPLAEIEKAEKAQKEAEKQASWEAHVEALRLEQEAKAAAEHAIWQTIRPIAERLGARRRALDIEENRLRILIQVFEARPIAERHAMVFDIQAQQALAAETRALVGVTEAEIRAHGVEPDAFNADIANGYKNFGR